MANENTVGLKPGQVVRGQRVEEGLVTRSKQMRHEMTKAESMLWKCLRANQLMGYRFRRQQIIAGSIADFYCHTAAIVIELDGDTHNSYSDRERDAKFAGLGIRTLRFRNEEVYRNLGEVLTRIRLALEKSP